jgi:hypothetical protein
MEVPSFCTKLQLIFNTPDHHDLEIDIHCKNLFSVEQLAIRFDYHADLAFFVDHLHRLLPQRSQDLPTSQLVHWPCLTPNLEPYPELDWLVVDVMGTTVRTGYDSDDSDSTVVE